MNQCDIKGFNCDCDGQPEIIMDSPIIHEDGSVWCHLTASSLETLHKFAQKIGLKREWFQDKPNRPHYDIKSMKIRLSAISEGAIRVNRHEFINKIKLWYGE